jgi:anti-sigma-K factor RskA
MNDTDRMFRAGNYVFGLMDEAERRRAERDLEVDSSFRAAVDALSQRIREADPAIAPPRRGQPRWDMVSASLAELPHLQGHSWPGRSRPGPAGQRLAGLARPLLAALVVAAVAFGAGYALGLRSGTNAGTNPPAASQAR